MYINIEKDFKRESYNRKYKILHTLLEVAIVIIVACIYIECPDIQFSLMILIEFIILIIFCIGCYIFMYLSLFKSKNVLLTDFFKIEVVKNRFEEIVHEKDVLNLKNILKKYGINTRHKVSIVLQHYQSVMYKNIKGSGQLLSILAFVISFLALIFSEHIISSYENIITLIEIVIIITLLYYSFLIINKQFFHYFSNEQFYIRMESYLSEIYIVHYKK